MSYKRDADRLARDLARRGFIVEKGGSDHHRVFWQGSYVVTFAASPSCCRWLRNTEAAIKRFFRAKGQVQP